MRYLPFLLCWYFHVKGLLINFVNPWGVVGDTLWHAIPIQYNFHISVTERGSGLPRLAAPSAPSAPFGMALGLCQGVVAFLQILLVRCFPDLLLHLQMYFLWHHITSTLHQFFCFCFYFSFIDLRLAFQNVKKSVRSIRQIVFDFKYDGGSSLLFWMRANLHFSFVYGTPMVNFNNKFWHL